MAEKWVRIMADYCATAFWARSGGNAGWDFVPVSPDLLAELAVWAYIFDWHDPFDEDEHRKLPSWWSATGLALAKRVKAELPDWTVVYFDDTKVADGVPRETFEYEIHL